MKSSKVKYNALISIQGEVPLAIENLDKGIFKNILKNYLEKTLECNIKIKECEICLEE